MLIEITCNILQSTIDLSLYLCWSIESIQVWCWEWCATDCPGKKGGCCSVLVLNLWYVWDMKCVVLRIDRSRHSLPNCICNWHGKTDHSVSWGNSWFLCPLYINIALFTWSLLCPLSIRNEATITHELTADLCCIPSEYVAKLASYIVLRTKLHLIHSFFVLCSLSLAAVWRPSL